MRQHRLLFLFLILSVAACRTDIDDKPAAQVTEVSSDTAAGSSTATPTSVGDVIKEKSSIGFIGAKVTGQHIGKFQQFDGRIEYVGNTPTAINFTIDPASVKTDAEKLDAHLKSADFFDVQKYPTATFVSKSIDPAPSGDAEKTHTITGTFTLHGVSKDITFPARVAVTPEGVHATSDFKINRHEWGVSYRGKADDLIRDDVAIQLDLWFPPPPTA